VLLQCTNSRVAFTRRKDKSSLEETLVPTGNWMLNFLQQKGPPYRINTERMVPGLSCIWLQVILEEVVSPKSYLRSESPEHTIVVDISVHEQCLQRFKK
jgi:hypothetical protein